MDQVRIKSTINSTASSRDYEDISPNVVMDAYFNVTPCNRTHAKMNM